MNTPMPKRVTINGDTFVRDAFGGMDNRWCPVSSLSMKGLVLVHNKVAAKPVKKFSDKETAVRRTWQALVDAEQFEELDAPEPAPVPAPAPAPAPAAAPKRSKRGMRFVFPPMSDGIRPARENSNRAILISMLTRPEGASFEELMAATWGKRDDWTDEKKLKTTYEGIRLVHYFSGYGLRQDEDGRIYAWTE